MIQDLTKHLQIYNKKYYIIHYCNIRLFCLSEMLRSSKSFFKVIPVVFLATATLLTLTKCDESKIITAAPHRDGKLKSNTLYFSGTGIRKKRIVMIDVHVYSIDLSLGKDALKDAKAWSANSDKTLVATVFDNVQQKQDGHSAIAINLKFLRVVSTTQIVEAFNDSFKGLDTALTNKFKDQLREAVGPNGFATGNTLEFFWLNGGGLVISVQGDIKGIFFGKEIEKRLLEVYIDSQRTVSPELVTSLTGHLSGSASSAKSDL